MQTVALSLNLEMVYAVKRNNIDYVRFFDFVELFLASSFNHYFKATKSMI